MDARYGRELAERLAHSEPNRATSRTLTYLGVGTTGTRPLAPERSAGSGGRAVRRDDRALRRSFSMPASSNVCIYVAGDAVWMRGRSLPTSPPRTSETSLRWSLDGCVCEQNRTGRSLTRSIRENAQDAPCSSVGGSTFWYSVACASAHSSRERCGHAACVAFRVAFTLLLDCDGARLPLRRRTRQTLQHVNADVSLEVLAERRVVLNETRISIAGASAKRRTVRALHALEVLVAWQRRRRVTTLMRNVPHGSEVARLCAQRREYITPRADRRR